jgi:glutaconate CoA-transferase subunit B
MCVGRVVSGSAFLYFAVPCIILFREKHLRPVMVDKADYINAGASRGVARRGAPHAFGAILFNPARRRVAFAQRAAAGRRRRARKHRLRLRSAGRLAADQSARRGDPRVLRGRVTQELAETYPQFRGNYSRRVRRGGTAPSQAARAGWQYPAA